MSYPLPNYYPFQQACDLIKGLVKTQESENDDVTMLVGGKTGSGKSTFVLDLVEVVDELKGISTPITNFADSLRSFSKCFKFGPERSIYVLDEGRELDKQNFQSKDFKAFKNFITKTRQLGNVVIICFTNPADVSRYLVSDRINMVCIVRKMKVRDTETGGKIDKRFAYLFEREEFSKLVGRFKTHPPSLGDVFRFCKRKHCGVNFITTSFPDYLKKGGRLTEEYKVFKRQSQVQAKEDFYNELMGDEVDEVEELIDPNVEVYNAQQVSKLLKVGVKTIKRWTGKDLLTPYYKKGQKGIYYYTKDEVKQFFDEHYNYKGVERPKSPINSFPLPSDKNNLEDSNTKGDSNG